MIIENKILIVDDDEHLLGQLEYILEDDYNVDTASCFEEAKKCLEAEDYSCVLTDGEIPQSGKQIEEYIGNLVANLAKEDGAYVIGMSREPQRLFKTDITIKKPFNPDDIIYALENKLTKNEFTNYLKGDER